MVAAPWRRFIQAARWNGHAAHRTTGEASVKVSHCQFVNCSVLIIEISSTGMPRTAATMSRLRSAASSGSVSVLVVVVVGGVGLERRWGPWRCSRSLRPGRRRRRR